MNVLRIFRKYSVQSENWCFLFPVPLNNSQKHSVHSQGLSEMESITGQQMHDWHEYRQSGTLRPHFHGTMQNDPSNTFLYSFTRGLRLTVTVNNLYQTLPSKHEMSLLMRNKKIYVSISLCYVLSRSNEFNALFCMSRTRTDSVADLHLKVQQSLYKESSLVLRQWSITYMP